MQAIVRNPIALWTGFVAVHLLLAQLGLWAPGLPLGDLSTYRFWIDYGLEGNGWVGIDTVWVYPILAIVPMLASAAFGPDSYAVTWLVLITLLHAAAFAVILRVGRRAGGPVAAWWWLGLLALLGPVALGRIDSVTVPIALVGLLVVLARPFLGGVLFAVAAWVKLWPAVFVGAVIVVARDRVRMRVLLAAAGVSVVILLVVLAMGAGANALSFLTQQTGRGVQIESVMATPWMWDAALGDGRSHVYYGADILTFQLEGPGIAVAAAVATPLIAVSSAVILLLGLLATRRGRAVGEVLPVLVLALTLALIVTNKVGSPQFVTWLAVPIVFGLVSAASGAGPSFRVPALLGLAIAALTHVIYPYLYHHLLGVPVAAMVGVLTIRNVLYVALLAWAVVGLVRLVRRPAEPVPEEAAGLGWVSARR